MKYNLELCEACADCRDPELYCKFREACVIWFLRKERLRAQRVGEQDRMAGKERGSV